MTKRCSKPTSSATNAAQVLSLRAAYCPDCGIHNSLQVFKKNLKMIEIALRYAETLDDADQKRYYIEGSLADCVALLDGFGKERCNAFSSKSNNSPKAKKISFQRLSTAAEEMKQLFGIDVKQLISTDDWNFAHQSFMRRHLLAIAPA